MKTSSKPKINLKGSHLTMANLMSTHKTLHESDSSHLSFSKASLADTIKSSASSTAEHKYQPYFKPNENTHHPQHSHYPPSQRSSRCQKTPLFPSSRVNEECEPEDAYPVLQHDNAALKHENSNCQSQRKYMRLEREFIMKRHQEVDNEISEAQHKIDRLEGSSNTLQAFIEEQQGDNKELERENVGLQRQLEKLKILSLKMQMIETMTTTNEQEIERDDVQLNTEKRTSLVTDSQGFESQLTAPPPH